MKTQLKKYIAIISFQVGVNCIGIPIFYNHYFVKGISQLATKTKYF